MGWPLKSSALSSFHRRTSRPREESSKKNANKTHHKRSLFSRISNSSQSNSNSNTNSTSNNLKKLRNSHNSSNTNSGTNYRRKNNGDNIFKTHKQQQEDSKQNSNNICGGKWYLSKKIGSGSFGEVYLANHLISGQPYAIKLEHKSDKKQHLKKEYEVYLDLMNLPKGYFVEMYWFGKYNDDYTALVMDLCGSSLKSLYDKCAMQFSMSTIGLIAVQLLDNLEKLHSVGWLHQDIKPENCVVNMEENKIYLIDFGTSARYLDRHTRKHREKGPSSKIVGTARYSSLSNHYGKLQSRRDDLESLGYMLLWFAKGGILPWQGINESDFRVKWHKVRRLKRDISCDELCYNLPVEFRIYLKYVMRLSFTQIPNYKYLRGLFHRLIERDCEMKISQINRDKKRNDNIEHLSNVYENNHKNIKSVISNNENDNNYDRVNKNNDCLMNGELIFDWNALRL